MNNHTVHPHPTRHDVVVHMNAMMPIHIINSYGSHTIIFHIIQPLMFTHQFSMHQHVIFHTIHAIQFKPFHMDIFGPTSTSGLFLTVPHRSVGCLRIAPLHQNGPKHQTHMLFIFQHNIKQFLMDHFGPTTIRTVLSNPKPSSGLSVGSPLTKHRFHFVEPRTHGHFRPHTHPKPLSCLFKQGISK